MRSRARVTGGLPACSARLSLTLAARRARSRSPRRRRPRRPGDDLRGAARAARPATRDRTLDEIQSFGVDRVRVLVYWQRRRARPRRRSASRASTPPTPPPIPPGLGPPRRLLAGAAARGIARAAHAHRAGARVGDGDEARTTSPARARGVPGLRDRGRPPLRRPGRRVVDLERAQPAAVPAAAVRADASRTRRASTAGSSSPASAACARLGQRARHGADRRDLAARQPRVVAPLAFLRGTLCLDRSYNKRKGRCGAARRRLRPPRLHDARRPAVPARRTRRRHDRRARAADQGARPRRQGRRGPARPRRST